MTYEDLLRQINKLTIVQLKTEVCYQDGNTGEFVGVEGVNASGSDYNLEEGTPVLVMKNEVVDNPKLFEEVTVYCDACKKTITLTTGRECGLEESDTSYDAYVAATACMPCSHEVAQAGAAVQKMNRDSEEK